MARVTDNRDVQRQNEARRVEKQGLEKTKREGQEFSKLVSQRQESTSKANQKAVAQQGRQASSRGAAGKALLARRGIAANQFEAKLQQMGQKSLGNNEVQSESRGKQARNTKQAGQEKKTRGDKARINKEGDKLAAISRDDREGQQGGGGNLDGGDSGNQSQLASGAGAVAQAEGAQTAATQQVQGATAPRISPELVQQLVERVLVGVNKEGLSEFQIEFKQDVLAGSRLSITAKDGKISAKFHTDDTNIGRLLKASEGELARAFGRKGLTLERLEVEGP